MTKQTKDFSPLFLLAILGAIFFHHANVGQRVTVAPSSEDLGTSDRVPASVGAANSLTVPTIPKAIKLENAAQADQSPAPSSVAQGSVAASVTPQQKESLTLYAKFKRKVFLSSDEESRKKDWFRDETLLRAVARLLRSPSGGNIEARMMQNSAVDMLLEARQATQSDIAAEVLRNVIQDSQVEDSSQSMSARQELAGIKAEILYQWSSHEPNLANQMQAWLPGPVSQKIWLNVMSSQASNGAESNQVAASRHGDDE